MVMALVVNTGLCAASGITANSFLAAGALVAAGSAAASEAAAKRDNRQRNFFMRCEFYGLVLVGRSIVAFRSPAQRKFRVVNGGERCEQLSDELLDRRREI